MKEAQNKQKEVVRDLFSRERERELRALVEIIESPDESYKKALLRFEKEVADPYVLASLVKALAVILKLDAPRHVTRYLRHQDGRVRANSMEALSLCGIDLKTDPKLMKLVLNFLGDPEPRVVTNCMRLLSSSLDRKQLLDLVGRYFDFEEERICLNVLYIIKELQLKEVFDLVQKCLNHPSKRVRQHAEDMLENFSEEHQEANRLSIRSVGPKSEASDDLEFDLDQEFEQTLGDQATTAEEPGELDMDFGTSDDGPMAQYTRIVDKSDGAVTHEYDEELSREYLKKLKEMLKSKDTQAQIGLLFEISRHNVGGELLDFLRELLTAKPDAFITATLVKVIGILSNEDEWNTLSVFLNHRNLRVVSNTVEALVSLKDKRLIPHLNEKIQEVDVNEAAQVRILTSGLPLLMEFQPEKAVEIVHLLAAGNLGAIASLVVILQKWNDPPAQVVQVAVHLVSQESRLEVTRSLCSFVEQWVDEKQYEEIRAMVRELEPGSRKKVILESLRLMERRLGIEAHEKLDLDSETQVGAQDLQKAAEGFLEEKGIEVQKDSFLSLRNARIAGIAVVFLAVLSGMFVFRNVWLGWLGFGSITMSGVPSPVSSESNVQKASSKGDLQIIKGHATVSSIDFENLTILAQGKEMYELSIPNEKLLQSFKTGQQIKFVGEFLEKEITDEVIVKIRYVFEDVPFKGRKG